MTRRRGATDPLPPRPDQPSVPDGDRLRRARAPQPVGSLLDNVVARRGWGERLRAGDLEHRWQEIVGATLATHCRPQRLAGGVLVVAADSPPWAAQLRYLETQIRERANTALGGGLVRSVEIVVDGGNRRA